MIYLKDSTTGIDVPIQDLQETLFAKLCSRWAISGDDYKSYGRCYRNQKPDGFIPEMFVGKAEGYKDLFLDENYAVSSFFGCDRMTITNQAFNADAHLIFAVNLSKIKIDIEHRADEEARMDVYSYVVKDPSFEVTEMVIGIDNVFREYTAWKKAIPNRDMMPFHFFRLNFTVKYIPNNIC